jgi:hypothetical protein
MFFCTAVGSVMDDNACHDKLGDVVPAITLPNYPQIRLAARPPLNI